MRYLLDAREAGRVDELSIKKFGIPSLVLMERAALSLAKRVAEFLDEKNVQPGHSENTGKKTKILVLCGVGNNGGDGVAAGRILREWGYDISIFLLGNREKASEEMKTQLSVAENLSMNFIEKPDLREFSVLVDAIFGIGLSREVTGTYAEWIRKMNESGSDIISVDIPSGICASTGAVMGTAVKADVTVTFGEGKLGHFLYPGAHYAGRVFIEEIGFPKEALEATAPKSFFYDGGDVRNLFPKRIPNSHKGSYGKLLVIAGSEDISGAAFFAAKAAYLTGCGLVKVVTHENNRSMLQEKLPEALHAFYGKNMFSGKCMVSEKGDEEICLPDLREDISWASAVVAGPGLGTDATAGALLAQVLEIRDKPVLIDADGINLLAGEERCVKDGELFLPENFVLTPHMLEMSRLTGTPLAELKAHPVEHVKKTREGAVFVLKDARTLVSDGERVYVNVSGNNALSKGGSGDVLSGVIGGLLARGTDIFTAAALGVYLHGKTAEEYIKDRSSSSMLASDILEMLPKVLP